MEKETTIDYKYNLKEYFSFLKNYKFLVGILVLLVLVHESKQILDKYLFKIVLDKGAEYLAGTVELSKLTQILFVVAIIFISATLLSMITNWLKIHFMNRIEIRAILELKHKYFSHIIHLDHNFHTTHKTGSLISRLGRGASSMERMTDTMIFDLSPLFFQTIIAVIALLYLDKIQALIIFLVMLIFISFSIYMQRKSEKSNIIYNKAEDREKGNMADFFTNLDSIRYFGKEFIIKQKYKELTKKTASLGLKNWDYYRYTSAVQSLILGTGTFLLLYFSIKGFLDGKVTIGTLGFIYTAYYSLIGPLFGFVHGVRNISRSMADFQELFEYGKIKPAIKDEQDAKKIKISDGEIEFKKIDFWYPDKKQIFDDFNLRIPKNKRVALVGKSGCGKTTLVKLLYRFYDLKSGEIKIDGQNIKNVKQESLRSEMSIVPQECILFDDTLYNNILFSNPTSSRNQVMNAIKSAQLDEFIKTLPKKEQTIVGERGVKLSGGEKQRVSIARAILANKKILVLDEATSSLDSETEFEIQKALNNLMKGRTSIIIAHRLSTIMNADLIVVMKKGKIVQMGNHRELITRGGEYQRLWDFQKGGYLTEKFDEEKEK